MYNNMCRHNYHINTRRQICTESLSLSHCLLRVSGGPDRHTLGHYSGSSDAAAAHSWRLLLFFLSDTCSPNPISFMSLTLSLALSPHGSLLPPLFFFFFYYTCSSHILERRVDGRRRRRRRRSHPHPRRRVATRRSLSLSGGASARLRVRDVDAWWRCRSGASDECMCALYRRVQKHAARVSSGRVFVDNVGCLSVWVGGWVDTCIGLFQG